jgi:serine/threonine-protein kinase
LQAKKPTIRDSAVLGQTLGHYEIIEPLGAGGMGEVYRAHDTRLKRDVAIKVLPADLSTDVERLARLEREAQLLAALSHPNIATIHGLEELEGEDGAPTRFLVMELIEGETLAEALSRGRIEVGKALIIAREIAEALQAAHGKGIIHRDLKPGNVMITPGGQTKVLDFGLAKGDEASDAAGRPKPGESTDLTESPTVAAATGAGIILGTAAYMSPEQARGKPLDNRTDIWSFGCLLYEMLTGHRPFDGETVTDVLAAIVERDPDWASVPDDVPPLIHVLLRRCLEKDTNERLHHIADARIEVAKASKEPELALPGAAPVAIEGSAWRRLLPWGIAMAAVVVAGLATSFMVRQARQTGASASPRRFAWNLPEGQSVLFGDSITLSRDGRLVVYVGISDNVQQLFLRSMDQLDALPIPGTEGAEAPFLSPDGQQIGFAIEDGVYAVHREGGSPRLLTRVSGNAFAGASWGTDGHIVFADGSLWSIPEAGGMATLLAEPDPAAEEMLFVLPKHMPDREAVLFTDFRGLTGASNRVAALSLETGEKKILIDPGGHATYLPTGHLLYASEGSLWAVPFDPSTLAAGGHPAPVVNGVQMFLGLGAQYTVSDDGTLLYLKGTGDAYAITFRWLDRQGDVVLGISMNRPGVVWTPRLSADERTVAFGLDGTDGRRSIWALDVEREVFSLLAADLDARSFEWSPDGTWIYLSADTGSGLDIWRQRANANTRPELVLERPGHQFVRSVSSDGQWLLFAETDSLNTGSYDIGLLSLTESGGARLLIESEANEHTAKFSSDGSWIAYTSDESGQREVYVRPFPEPGGRTQISSDGGLEPVWSRDGRKLFYRRNLDLMSVEVETGLPFSAGPPRIEIPRGLYYSPFQTAGSYDVTQNGGLLMLDYGGLDSRASSRESLIVVLDWFEELKRLVPTER